MNAKMIPANPIITSPVTSFHKDQTMQEVATPKQSAQIKSTVEEQKQKRKLSLITPASSNDVKIIEANELAHILNKFFSRSFSALSSGFFRIIIISTEHRPIVINQFKIIPKNR